MQTLYHLNISIAINVFCLHSVNIYQLIIYQLSTIENEKKIKDQ